MRPAMQCTTLEASGLFKNWNAPRGAWIAGFYFDFAYRGQMLALESPARTGPHTAMDHDW
jgi:hypothetical protein